MNTPIVLMNNTSAACHLDACSVDSDYSLASAGVHQEARCESVLAQNACYKVVFVNH
jgi:hypothetical protein